MAYTSEIEKLEARYRENPKGRNFAPLADAYRKAGLIDNAIELCQAGLQLHPDYVSGHIVLGRCLVDKKDDTGAEGVFRRVLSLDPENILALKVLAEIAERNNSFEDAGEWLNRLLLADPMNGEAAEGLSRVRGKAAVQATLPAPAATEQPVATRVADPEAPLEVVHEEPEIEAPAGPSGQAAGSPRMSIEYMEGPFDAALADAATAAMGRPDFDLERASEPPPQAIPAAAGEIETFDGLIDFDAAVSEVATPEGIQFEEPTATPTSDAAVLIDGLARTQYEGSGLFKLDAEPPAAPIEALADRTTSPMADLPLILPEDVATSAPRTTGGERRTVDEPPPQPAALQIIDDDGAADTATLSRAEPVVTETMAELYLRQGHREDALRVYEALSQQRPHDARLLQRVAELSEPRPRPSGSGQSAGAFLKGILNARPGTPALPPLASSPLPPPTPLLADVREVATSGPRASPPDQAIDFDVSPAPGDVQPPPHGPGSPTRPASDAISLDSVFGEEGGRGSIPALPEPVPDSSSKLPAASGGFSFDDFFGSSAVPPTGPTKGATPAPRPPRTSGRNRPAEQEEDLDQFQAWLKSLKA